ncbi:unnamed protein product [Symbiodinium microadriaticum]|nr:unnamed protein product [Symbiodinium microadriaticum]
MPWSMSSPLWRHWEGWISRSLFCLLRRRHSASELNAWTKATRSSLCRRIFV